MVRHADVVVCVFNAENPKTKSHIDILAPLVAYFDGPALVAAVERCGELLAGAGLRPRADDVDELADSPRIDRG